VLEYHLVETLVNVISAAQTTSMFTQTPLLSIHFTLMLVVDNWTSLRLYIHTLEVKLVYVAGI